MHMKIMISSYGTFVFNVASDVVILCDAVMLTLLYTYVLILEKLTQACSYLVSLITTL